MRGGPTCVGDGITWSHGEPGGSNLSLPREKNHVWEETWCKKRERGH